MIYLYKITNIVNNKVYIGQSIDPEKRWTKHKSASIHTPTQTIHHAMKKHGITNFVFEIVAVSLNQDDANEIETELVSQYDCHISSGKGYNVTYGGSNAPKSEEWKQLISEKAKERFENDPKYKEQVSLRNKGKQHTDEARANMSAAHIGQKAWNEGKKMSPEAVENNRQGQLGKILTTEHCKNISLGLMGHPTSEETARKISAAQKGIVRPHHLLPNSGQFKKGQVARNKKYNDDTIKNIANDIKMGLSPKEIQLKYSFSKTLYYKILKTIKA